MTDEALRRFLLRVGALAAACALFCVAARYLLAWLAPFLFAAAAAAAMEPAVCALQTRFRFRRGFSSLILTLFLLFLLGGLLSLLGAALTDEASALLSRANALLAAIPASANAMLGRLRRCADACPPWLYDRLEAALTRYAAEADSLFSALLARLLSLLGAAAAALPRLFLATATALLAVYYTSASLPALRVIAQSRLSNGGKRALRRFSGGMARSLSHWLRAELTLCAVTFFVILSGLLLLQEPYALLLSVFITLVDALPVFGTGTVLLPWAALELLIQDYPRALALLGLYLLALTLRNTLEPRLLSSQAGLPPIVSLAAMYLGFCLSGVGGMILLPFLLLFAAQFLRQSETAAGRS